MFRKLYWVTEVISGDNTSRVGGVYTSIPDLIHHGLAREVSQIRLTLTKLDSDGAPMGCWQGPGFDGIDSEIQAFVKTEEFTQEQCAALLKALRG